VLERINHSDLRTIYPPVAQGVFALAHWIGPWKLTAWRGLILILDMVTIALLLALLRDLGRSPLWAALYWWNPIVLKELFNSAHMDAIIVPLILGALLLAIRKRPLAATACLTLAAGAKIWPLILLPLVWRGLLDKPRKLALAIALTVLACSDCRSRRLLRLCCLCRQMENQQRPAADARNIRALGTGRRAHRYHPARHCGARGRRQCSRRGRVMAVLDSGARSAGYSLEVLHCFKRHVPALPGPVPLVLFMGATLARLFSKRRNARAHRNPATLLHGLLFLRARHL
jgi:hypothetical protein